jgi:nicotinate dehydrogenase subunit B
MRLCQRAEHFQVAVHQRIGGGEASTAPMAAAVANAIFDALGVRLREVPLNPKRVLSALRG